ncbi:MAG: ComEC/Rec2 family competence protein [Xenococcaceae cyanobacterium MO_167.B27]|nr:ComEC/Rec2 family competence protein [Xenococcaceae cyanobacterium MO_167.B27]
MNRDSWIITCWSYVLGLLTTGIFYFDYVKLSIWNEIQFLAYLTLLGIVIVLILSRLKYFQFKNLVYVGMIGVFIVAPIYFQLRYPQPKVDDISRELTKLGNRELVVVTGKVLDEPRLTESNKIRLWLKVNQFQKLEPQNLENTIKEVSGKLYVTLPLLEVKNIYPQQYLKIKGFIYEPKISQNPGQFNFKRYLQNQGCFAGFKGLNIIQETTKQKPSWGWWKVRRRIIRAQVRGLDSPIGQLVSSMVLGRRAVDLPHDIRNLFIKTGLAHILAASGFHVSLLLGMVLRLTSSLTAKLKLGIGLGCLFIYSCLTGFSPSVMRAVLMGSGVLIALSIGGKVKPLGSLLLSLIILLLVNPLWIWNLGLQLSFLATLGLIISVPAIEKKLDWMPPLFATAVSIPLAASIWTLPLIIFTFNTVSTYSIIVNVVSMPLVTAISLGGMISSLISLMIPVIGSLCTSVLYYPCILLIEITNFFSNLPGSILVVGKISLGIVIIIYGLICMTWLNQWWQKKWWLSLLLSIVIISVPIAYTNLSLFKITVLKAYREPIVVIQDRGEVVLINSGKNSNTVKYTIIPFLVSQGINKIDYGIALNNKYNSSESWSYLSKSLVVKDLILNNNAQILSENQAIKTDSTVIDFIEDEAPVINIKTDKYNWLITDNLERDNLSYLENYIKQNQLNSLPLVLLWAGNKLEPKWLNLLHPEVAIAINVSSSNTLFRPSDRETPLTKSKGQNKRQLITQSDLDWTYIIENDGAITWTPKRGFQSNFQIDE